MANLNSILKEYFLHREDGGAYFDVRNQRDFMNFEKFLTENGYGNHFDRDAMDGIVIKEDDDFKLQQDSPDSVYVANRYKQFFKSSINKSELDALTSIYSMFTKKYNQANLQTFKSFIRDMPTEAIYLIDFEKNQIGKGEFAMFLLFPSATKLPSSSKGDIKIPEGTFEIKKETNRGESIRFGTNINLDSIGKLRTLTFSMRDILFMEKNKDVHTWAKAWDVTFAGSEASVTMDKLKELYKFIESLKEYCLNILRTKNVDMTSNETVAFKLYNSRGPVTFQIPTADVKTAIQSEKSAVQTTISRVSNSPSNDEEVYSFCKKAMRIIMPFLRLYPTVSDFSSASVKQLESSYNSAGVHIMIIDYQYKILIYPTDVTFEFYSVNQWTRPQVKIKR